MLQLRGFIIDCPDALELATFYSRVTGGDVIPGSNHSNAAISCGDVDLAFQRVERYRPPVWPDDEHPKQFHLDFEVDDIEAEERRVLDLGAIRHRDLIGAGGFGWRVYIDPDGHPFCLCHHEGVTWVDGRVAWPD